MYFVLFVIIVFLIVRPSLDLPLEVDNTLRHIFISFLFQILYLLQFQTKALNLRVIIV